MPVICYNLLNSITDKVVDRLKNENRDVVWYGGRKVLGVLNDCLNIMGGKIDYAIVDKDKVDNSPIDYIWSIPLINKHIKVDINKSQLLSEYHIEMHQPKAVDLGIADILKNNALYVLSSDFAREMTKILIGKGIDRNNVWIIESEKESESICEKRIRGSINGKKLLSLDEIHETEFEILRHFKDYCDKNDLRYWLGGGTMLGAIRHEGFIPWDDDVDVFMPDTDYRRFVDIYRDNQNYELLNYAKDLKFPFYFSKLSDKRTILWHHEFPVEYIMGAYIDIFPLVGYPGDMEKQSEQWEIEHLTMAEWYWYKDLAVILGEENMPVSGGSILRKMVLPAFDESDFVGQVSVIQQKQWVSRREDFSGYINKRFEKEAFRVPVGYDAHLRERYGDYMQLPPEDKREVHSFPIYR